LRRLLLTDVISLLQTLLLLSLTGSSHAELDGYGAMVDPLSIVILVLAVIGLLVVVIVEIIIISKIIRLRGVPWRTVWLGQILLLAILLSYLVVFVFAFKPTVVVCSLERFGVGVCYALMLSVLFVKILIVLSPKTDSGFLKFGHQVMVLLLVWAIQIAINSQWLILAPSETESYGIVKVTGPLDRTETLEGQRCSATKFETLFFDTLASLVFVLLVHFIILIVTLVAFNRGKRQGKVNSETRWILLAMSVNTVLWLLWILIGAFLLGAGMATVAIGLWAIATSTLIIMFVPKLHKLATLKPGGKCIIFLTTMVEQLSGVVQKFDLTPHFSL